MAITSAELVWKGSGGSSPGNSTAVADPNNWLGTYMSSTTWAGGSLHDLFDIVTGDENAASDVEYRCVFVHNTNGSLTLQSPKLWFSAVTSGGADLAVALAGQGVVSATQAGTPQADTIANENTAPSGETFSAPTSKGAGISVPNIPSGSCIGIWVRRTATNSSAQNSDGGTVRIEGDTAA